MTSSGEKLLDRMRRTKSGWGQGDFKKLLTAYDFKSSKGGKHAKYYHAKYPDLRISVPRHNSLKEWVAEDAVLLIDELTKRLLEERT